MSINRERLSAHIFSFAASSVAVRAQIDFEHGNAVNEAYAGPAAALPPTGGQAKKAVTRGGTRYLKHGKGDASVSGTIDRSGNVATVTASALVEGLAIRNTPTGFRAAHIQASTSTQRELGETGSVNDFASVKVTYRGLEILRDGVVAVTIDPVVDLTLCGISTLAKLEKEYQTNKSFFNSHGGRFMGRNTRKPRQFGIPIPRIRGPWVGCSVVESLLVNGVSVPGHIYDYPGLGRLVFGEMLIQENHRRLTALRIYLGCEFDGICEAADIDHNSN